MPLASAEELLRSRIGLDAHTIGAHAVTRAVKTCMRRAACADEAAYLRRLRTDPAAMEELIEAVLTHETWFFRDQEAFAYLPDALPGKEPGSPPLRVLSAGCSTGEEPYTIAMALLDAGRDRSTFRIDAVDISHQALDAARKAVYRENAFRSDDLAFRERHFDKTPEGYRLRRDVAACVDFAHANVVDASFPEDRPVYDAVFFRHVLIYLDGPSGRRALAGIRKLLRPRGLLFVGGTECARARKAGFQAVPLPGVFAFLPPAADAEAVREEWPAAEPASGPLPIPQRRPAGHRRRKSRTSRPAGGAQVPRKHDHCWERVGTYGSGSCEKLSKIVHCLRCGDYIGHGRTYFERVAPEGYLAQWASVVAERKEEQDPDLESMLIFRLCREWFALPARLVREVASPSAIHTIPHRTNRVLLGMANTMGRLHLCVSLHGLFDIAADENGAATGDRGAPRMVVIGNRGGREWAFPADEVNSVQRLRPREMRPPPPTVSTATGAYTKGVLPWQTRAVGYIDGDALFAALERSLT